MRPKQVWSIEYDFHYTAYFRIEVVGIREVSMDEAKQCPRQVSEPDCSPLILYQPPPGVPSLDELFPNANKLLFGPFAQWIGLFPCGKKVPAFVEAGPDAGCDMVFANEKFESVRL